MALNGNTDETNGYNSVIKNGTVTNANLVKSVIPPIGTVMSWLKTFTNTPALPDGWVECNGQTLSDSDSPYDGQVIPDLNGDARFLYGAATSGGTKTENFLPVHTHTAKLDINRNYTGFQGNNASTGISTGINDSSAQGTAWVGYAVVYIMRVK